jgi:glycosyltransferase involved in cell wall biosynthesis
MRPDEKTMLHIRNRQYLKSAYKALLEDKRFTLCLNSVQGMKSYQEWLDFEDGRLRVVFNGIDLESIINNENEQEVEEFLSIKNINGKKIVGGIFRFVKEKRLELWIETAKKTIDERDDVVFIAVGDGNEREKAIALVEGTRYGGKILFPGSTNAVSSWLKKFDLFILTSVVEGLPNVLIEAQSFGVPVLSTRAGGAEDTFINLDSGVLLTDEEPEQIANYISLCLDDFSWRKRASKSGEEFAMKSFSKESMVETICQLYDEVSIHYYKRWQKDANIITKMLAAVGRD